MTLYIKQERADPGLQERESNSELLNSRITALTDLVSTIDRELEEMGNNVWPGPQKKFKEEKMDKVLFASEYERLHSNLTMANKALLDRVTECRKRGLTSDVLRDIFWPNVTLPGCSKPGTVTLKDYGCAVDNAFYALMNFLLEKSPEDSKEFMRKRNRLLNDKLTSLMELRKCQLELLPDEDYGVFSLSQWTLFALKELPEIDPTTGKPPSGIALLRRNFDVVKVEGGA